jgi:hypothetical protein
MRIDSGSPTTGAEILPERDGASAITISSEISKDVHLILVKALGSAEA